MSKPEIETFKRVSVVIRHGTPFPKYRRAGLVLTQTDQVLEITELQFEVLKRDQWIIMHEIRTLRKDKKQE